MSLSETILTEAFSAQREGFFGFARHDRIERLPPAAGGGAGAGLWDRGLQGPWR